MEPAKAIPRLIRVKGKMANKLKVALAVGTSVLAVFFGLNFDVVCLIVSAYIMFKSQSTASKIIFFEFAGCFLIYKFGIEITGALNPWKIYLAYSVLQIIVCTSLYLYKCNNLLNLIVFSNVILNILTLAAFFKPIFISIYYDYSVIAATIMIAELTTLFIITSKENGKHRKSIDNNGTDPYFRISRRSLAGGFS